MSDCILGDFFRELVKYWCFSIGRVRVHDTRSRGTWGSKGWPHIQPGLYAESMFYFFFLSTWLSVFLPGESVSPAAPYLPLHSTARLGLPASRPIPPLGLATHPYPRLFRRVRPEVTELSAALKEVVAFGGHPTAPLSALGLPPAAGLRRRVPLVA